MFLLLCIGAVIALGLFYQAIGQLLDDRRFPPPGRLVSTGALRLHLHQQGAGEPVVVLEAGIAGSSLGWALVQPEIGKFTSVCSYDRAGLGWSAKPEEARTVDQMTSELRGLLASAGCPPPYILVGHSFGGLLIRAYAYRYPSHVAGLLFVDPVSLCEWTECGAAQRQRLLGGARLSRRGALLARLGIVRAALALLVAGSRQVPKLIGRTAAGKGLLVLERLVGQVQKLPPAVHPMIQSHWSSPKCFLAMAAYLECLPASAAEAQKMRIPAGIPFTVLSAENATQTEFEERESWTREKPNARHVVVAGSGHWIQIEKPEAVVSAVKELIETVRNAPRLVERR